jgi:hypothetical protein
LLLQVVQLILLDIGVIAATGLLLLHETVEYLLSILEKLEVTLSVFIG